MKRIVVSILAAVVVTAGLLSVGTGTADAAIRSGNYTYVVDTAFGGSQRLPVNVNGNTFTWQTQDRLVQRFVPTRSGGYMDVDPIRYTFVKSGSGYVGRQYLLGVPILTHRLIRR